MDYSRSLQIPFACPVRVVLFRPFQSVWHFTSTLYESDDRFRHPVQRFWSTLYEVFSFEEQVRGHSDRLMRSCGRRKKLGYV